MKVIFCMDDRGGLLFNHSRQSRDREVIADIVGDLDGKSIYIDTYSADQFKNIENAVCVDTLSSVRDGVCFVENVALTDFGDAITELTVYKWNRHYPSDTKLPDSFLDGFTLQKTLDFPGHSHEKITKEIYVK